MLVFFIHLLWEKFREITLGGLFPHGVLPTPNLLEKKKNHCGRATATMGSVTSDSSSVVAEGAPALAAAGEGSAAAAGAAGAAGGSAWCSQGGENGWRKKVPVSGWRICKCGICIVDFLLKNVLFVVCNPEISLEEEFLI